MITIRRKLMAKMQSGGGDIPAEYQPVQYLRNTDRAYIMTDWASADVTRLDIQFHYNAQKSWASIVGSSINMTDPVGNLVEFGTGRNMTFRYNGVIIGTVPLPSVGEDYNLSAIWRDGDQKLILNGNTLITGQNTTPNNGAVHMSFFGIYYGSQDNKPGERALIDCYGCQFYGITGRMISGYRPVYRKSDHIAGYYDVITGEFLTNAGTGSFVIGPDIN